MSNAAALAPLNAQQRRAKQEILLNQKINEFLLQAAAKFSKDTKDICGLNQSPCVKLISKDKRNFWMPKNLLLARSPAWKHNILEEGDGIDVLYLSKISSISLEVLVQYLEKGTLHADWRRIEVIKELCEIAVEYEFFELLEFLKGALVNLCDSEDIAGTFMVLAELTKRLNLMEAYKQIIEWLKAELANQRCRMVHEIRVNRRLQEANRQLREQMEELRRQITSQLGNL